MLDRGAVDLGAEDHHMPLYLKTRYMDKTAVVDCKGKLVHGDETATLRQVVADLIPEYRQIVLNFAGVTYVDSSGLGLLMSLHASAQKAGAVIKLCALNSQINDLLQLTRLAMILEICESVQVAVQSFKAVDAA
jgi:anti-anti-sigma factor